MKYKAAEEAGSGEVSENRNNKVEDVAGKMPQTDSEKENALGRKGIPDNVAMNVDGGAQENTHGTVSASELLNEHIVLHPLLLSNICFSSNSGDSDVLGDCSFNVIARFDNMLMLDLNG